MVETYVGGVGNVGCVLLAVVVVVVVVVGARRLQQRVNGT